MNLKTRAGLPDAYLLSTLDGIGTVRANSICNNWKDEKIVREIMIFLQSHGVGTTRATRILCAGHGKEVEDESSLQADLKRSASLDKVILVREWLKEVDGKIRLERTETR